MSSFKPRSLSDVLPYRKIIAVKVFNHLAKLTGGPAEEAALEISCGRITRNEIATQAAKSLGLTFKLSRRQQTAILYRYAAEHGIRLA